VPTGYALELHRRAVLEPVDRLLEEADEGGSLLQPRRRGQHGRAADRQHDGADQEQTDRRRVRAYAHVRPLLLRVRNLSHFRIGRVVAQLCGVAERGHGLLLDVEEQRAVRDPEDAREVVRHHDDGRAEARLQLEDQVVEKARADRVQAGRRLIEEQQIRVERDRTRQRRALAHAAADRGRVELLEAAQPHQRELELDDFGDHAGVQARELLERQRHVLRQRQPAPQGAVLVEHAHAPPHTVAPRFIRGAEVLAAEQDRAAGRLLQPDQVLQQRALAAAAAAHDDEHLAARHREAQVLHDDVRVRTSS
jgi:hypothetical protein